MNFVEYVDADILMVDLASKIAGELENHLLTQDRVSLCVPGGSTPAPMFDSLSAANVDWARVDVLLTDERWVPEDSDRSNTRMIKNRLLQGPAAAANLVPFFKPGLDAHAGATAMSDALDAMLPLGVLVLGMGTDMHCASLFPGAPELKAAQANDAPALMPMTPGDGLEPRVTLTARVLAQASNTHILIVGEDKKIALNAAQDLPFDQAPVGQFLQQATVHWARS